MAAWMTRRGPGYWIGYAIHDPRDFAYSAPRRIACRLLGRHNATCRGRRDHPRNYQEGGWLKPGWTTAHNTSQQSERVTRPSR